MKNRQREMKYLYLACSVFGIGYFVLSLIALFADGAMHRVFFGLEDSLGSVAYFASMLFWWVSIQLYLRSLPEPKLPPGPKSCAWPTCWPFSASWPCGFWTSM